VLTLNHFVAPRRLPKKDTKKADYRNEDEYHGFRG